MLKELKYIFFISAIILFFFFTLKYYFSDQNIKNSFRSITNIDRKINIYEKNLIILKNNTDNIIEYSENQSKKKKKYYFMDLLRSDE